MQTSRSHVCLIEAENALHEQYAPRLHAAGYHVTSAPPEIQSIHELRSQPPDLAWFQISSQALCDDLVTVEQRGGESLICLGPPADARDVAEVLGLNASQYVLIDCRDDDLVARLEQYVTLQQLQTSLSRQLDESSFFAQALMHNVRNDMTIIYNITVALAREQISQENEQLLLSAAQSVENMKTTTDTLLTCAQLLTGELDREAADMHMLVSRVFDRLKYSIGRTDASVHLADDLPLAFTNPDWIAQVWNNLIVNALEHAGPCPKIEIGGETLVGDRVRYWIRDSGKGLANKTAPTRREVAAEPPQRGLGLLIVERILQPLDGTIVGRNREGGGAEFVIELPSAPTIKADVASELKYTIH